MILRKYVINQKKFKIFLLLINLVLIILTLIFLKFDKPIAEHVTINSNLKQFSSSASSSQFSSSSNNNDIIQFQHNVLTKKNQQQNYENDIEQPSQQQQLQQQQQQQDGNIENKIKKTPIIPEKYNEYDVKQRIIQDKIKYLTEIKNTNSNNNNNNNENENEIIELKKNTQHIHIFYNLPVSWYKEDIITNTITAPGVAVGQQQQNNLESSDINTNINNISSFSYSSSTNNNNLNNNNINNSKKRFNNLNKSILDTAYYPFRGPYKQDNRILREHLNSIRNAGIGVLVIELNSANTIRIKLLDKLFKLVPKYNISITFEINVNRNRTVEYLNEILLTLKQYFNKNGIYKVYSIKKQQYIPLIYVIDAYKLQIPDSKPTQCLKKLINLNLGNDLINNNNNDHNDIILIAHIRFKEHTDIVKKLCFDGFYSKMPSNGAFYASTWKNWSFLSRYAKLNDMIFIPTVGPGYMQKKIPRHGGFEKDRSNGKYYGFAWSTALAQNPQFISIASYNNWREGTQIEEATVKPNYMNYLPGKPTKYLHLTAHWANNYIKIKEKNQLTYNKCYNLFNNTIC